MELYNLWLQEKYNKFLNTGVQIIKKSAISVVFCAARVHSYNLQKKSILLACLALHHFPIGLHEEHFKEVFS
jgi:hypothetical protein